MSVSVIFSVFELSNIYDRKEKRGKKKKTFLAKCDNIFLMQYVEESNECLKKF